MTENEKRVRAFYDAIVPGRRERVCSLQATSVVYEVPEGMPTGGGRFQGIPDIPEQFLPKCYGAFDVRFFPEEFIAEGDRFVAIGRVVGKTREGDIPINVSFAHVWTVGSAGLERLRFFTDTAVLAAALARTPQ